MGQPVAGAPVLLPRPFDRADAAGYLRVEQPVVGGLAGELADSFP
jgi:hypothetical protein